jgi:small subunit ribosomal protein S16
VPVTLRLARHGVRSKPFYRIVAADKTRPRNGKYIDIVGTYAPRTTQVIEMKEDRVKHWLAQGAQVSDVVRDLIKKKLPGVIEAIETRRTDKVRAARKARKARAAKRTAPAKKK